MKNMKKMSRRGLAMLIVLMMCLSMMPVTAFASESVEPAESAVEEITSPAESSSENSEPSQDDTQDGAPAENDTQDGAPAEDDAQDGAPAEDDAQDDAQDGAPAEDDTQDGAPAEDDAQDGAPAEDDTQDGAPAEDDAQDGAPAEDDTQDGAPAEDDTQDGAPAEDDAQDGAPAEDDAQDGAPAGEQQPAADTAAGVKDSLTENLKNTFEEILPPPAEVQAFLDAVAAIPAITPDNAAEVAEYVYGPVSEAYEALLDTDFMDREDVQEAEAAYAAAIEAVDAALGMESDTYLAQISGKTPTDRFYYNGIEVAQLYEGTYPLSTTYQYNNPSTTVAIFVGDPGNYQYLYTKAATCHCGNVLVEETPDWIAVDVNRKLTDSNPGIIQGKPTWNLSGYVAEDWSDYGYEGYPALQINVVGAKPGNTSIRFQAYQNYYYAYYWQQCPVCGQWYSEISFKNKWIEDTQTLNVIVNARYQLNYDTQGGSYVAPTTKDAASTVATLNVTSTVPTRTNYTFDGWYYDKEYENPVGESVTLDWARDGKGTNPGSKDNPVSKTLYAKWQETGPNKTYTVTYTDGVIGRTVFPDQGYEGLKEGDPTPAFVGGPPTSYTDDAGNTYTFQGWSPTVNPVVSADDADANGNIIYTATWQKQLKDLTVSKSPSEEYPVVGEEFSYTITVNNPNSKEIQVKITDVLDEKLDFVAAGDGGSYDKDTRTVTWTDVTVPANGSKNVTVYVKANAAGEIYNEVKIECEVNETSGNTTVTAQEPTKYTVTYEWSGLPEKHGQNLPSGGSYAEGTEVTVDNTYQDGSTVVVDGKTYVFSGWSTTDATIEDGKFEMPDHNVVISGTWNEKLYNVKYEWTLPDGVTLPDVELPEGGKYAESVTVKVDGEYTSESTRTVDGSIYTFSGWSTTDAEVENGQFTMPGNNVTIVGAWTKTAVPPTPITPSSQVRYLVQWYDKGGEKLKEDEVRGPADIGTTVEVTEADKVISGYTFDASDDRNVLEGTLSKDQVVILKLYFTKDNDPEYTVSYTWTGLPEGAATLPTGGSYAEGTTVTVNSSFTAGTEVTYDGKTYVFSGWDRTGTFAMPDHNVVISGSWTEKTYTVRYTWTGLPSGASVTLPGSSSHRAGDAVNVNSTFVSGSTTTVNGDTYVFSGWDRTGSFEMPAENVVISGSWSVRSGGGGSDPDPDPTPTPDPDPDPDPDPTPTPDPTPGTDPQPDVPPVEVTEPDVPLSDIPEVPLTEAPEVITEIPEEEVPLAEAPKTGDNTWIFGALTFLSGLGLALLGLRGGKRREDED